MTDQQVALAAPRPPLVALALAGAALLLGLGLGSADARSRDGQSSLDRAVQSLIAAGWFEAEDNEQGREIVLRADPATEKVDPAHQRIVGRIHRLETYMKSPDLWQFDESGNVTGFDVNESIPGPFDNTDTWSGQMRYARMPQRDEIPLVRLGASIGRIDLAADRDLRLVRGDQQARIDVRRPAAEPVSGAMFELMCGAEPAALVYRIGEAVVVNASARGACEVRLGEQRLGDTAWCKSRHISSGRCAFGVLRPGDVLAFAARAGKSQPSRVIARYQRRTPPSAAMVMRRNASREKIPARGLGPFVDAIARDLGRAMVGCATTGASLKLGCTEDLKLSFDYEVQRDLQQALDRDLAEITTRRIPGTAAVVVMNSRSGEVLAMGGYQTPENRNCRIPALCLLPVGSTAKPVFATAMIGGFKGGDLSTLKVQYRGAKLQDILGLAFARPVNNENSSGRIGDAVGLQSFLQLSDNHYAETMLLLASAVPNGGDCPMTPGDWYELDGRKISGSRPRSSFENQACKPLDRGYQAPFPPPWADKLADYFALTPYRRDDENPDEICSKGRFFGNLTYDATPWFALFPEDANRCQMINAGLQRNWMRIDRLRDFRTEAVPMLLGNSGGHWTAVKLAEAFSRLATGKMVRASFMSLSGAPVSQAIDFTNGEVDARVAVSAGLARVLQGTAGSSDIPAAVGDLRAKLAARGYRLGVFAKTGTMQLAGTMARGCPRSNPLDECVGKAFVIVLAVYPSGLPLPKIDERTGLAIDASATPQCAITLAVNLPRWNGEVTHGNPAANFAAQLIRGAIGARLLELEGPYCGPRT